MPSFSVSFVRSGIEFVPSISSFALDASISNHPTTPVQYTQDGLRTRRSFSKTMLDRPTNVGNVPNSTQAAEAMCPCWRARKDSNLRPPDS
jgi:hypothetical protein